MKKTTNQPAGRNMSRRHLIGAAAAASALPLIAQAPPRVRRPPQMPLQPVADAAVEAEACRPADRGRSEFC